MRRFYLIAAYVFAILSIAMTILPMGTIALLPALLTLIFSTWAFVNSTKLQKLIPRIVLIIALLTTLVILGKVVLVKDKVQNDKLFEQKKEENKKKDLKELEGL
jgi:thiol:disulfide interchange protein